MTWAASAVCSSVKRAYETYTSKIFQNKPVVFVGSMPYTEDITFVSGGDLMPYTDGHIPEAEPDEWELELLVDLPIEEDPFWSAENQEYLRRAVADTDKSKWSIHELIDADG